MKKSFLSILVAAGAAISLSAQAADMKKADPGAASKMASSTVDAKTKAAVEGRMNEFVAAWNKHDPKAMAAVWSPNGYLINPFGMKAEGRAEIEKLFEQEQGGVMKASTYTINSGSLRKLPGGAILGDWESVVTGMQDPEGKALPSFEHHVTMVYVEHGGQWRATEVRAFQLLPPPGK